MRSILLIFAITSLAVSSLFGQDWFNAIQPAFPDEQTGFSSNDQATGISQDRDGNIYATGYFQGKLTVGNTTLISNGSRDIFVGKMDTDGNWIWVTQAGGESSDFATSIAVDVDGNAYITGYYYNKIGFGNINLSGPGNSDIFIAKINNQGDWQWARSAGGNSFDNGNAIAVDSIGNVFLTGYFQDDSNFGQTQLSSAGNRDVFVGKLNSSGDWQWVKRGGSSFSDEGLAIEFDRFGSVIIGGYFRNDATFGQDQLVHNSNKDIFISSLDSDGNWNWTKGAGSSSADELLDIAISNDGNYYATGYFNNSITLDNITISSEKDADLFVAKINNLGDWQWAASAGDREDDVATSISINSNSEIVVSGTIDDDATFGTTDLESAGSRDIFIAKLDDTGSWLSAVNYGDENTDDAYDIVIDINDNIFIAGAFFGESNIGEPISSLGSSDILITSFSDSGQWRFTNTFGGVNNYVEIYDYTTDSDGNIYFTGKYYGEVRFGRTTLSSEGLSDIFVAKLDFTNNWVWAVSAGGAQGDECVAIGINDNGNIAISGYYFDRTTIGNETLFGRNGFDVFVAVLDNQGVWQWAERIASFNFEEPKAMTVDSNGDFILTGYFESDLTFGGFEVESLGDYDMFIAKFDDLGNWKFATSAGGGDFDEALALTTDSQNNIYVTGYFTNSATFGSLTATSFGNDDVFVGKLSPTGVWQWVEEAGSSSWREKGVDIKYHDGNVYVTGSYQNNATFGSDILLSQGDVDVFFSKLDTDGNWVWTKDYGGDVYDQGDKIFIDEDNSKIYLAGNYNNSISFGDNFLTSSGERDIFITTFDYDGSILSAESVGGFSNEAVIGIGKTKFDNIFLAGNYIGSVDFNNITLNQTYSIDRSSFVAFKGTSNVPNGWDFTQTGLSAQIEVPLDIEPEVNDRALVEGDLIGVFFDDNGTNKCAGYGYWQGNDLVFSIYGDDTNTAEKDGLSNSENFIFYVWDSLLEESVQLNVGYASGPNNFQDQGYTILQSIPFRLVVEHTVNLVEGWNYVGLYVYPGSQLITDIFSGIVNDMIIARSERGIYLPSWNFNTMNTWDYESVHKIYVTSPGSFSVTSDKILPETEDVSVEAGWNELPYWRDTDATPADAYQNLGSDLVMVRDYSGGMYIPRIDYNTIGDIKVATGYRVYSASTTTFRYPANPVLKAANITKNKKFLQDDINTGNYSNLILESNLFVEGGILFATNENGEIHGGAFAIDNFAILEFRGDNEYTDEVDGFVENEQIIVQYRSPEGELFSLKFENIVDMDRNSYDNLTFLNNKVLKAEIIPQKEQDYNITVSPNPASEKITISTNSEIELKGDIIIVNSAGKVVGRINNVFLNGRYNNISYNLNELSNGYYNLVFKTNEKGINIPFLILK